MKISDFIKQAASLTGCITFEYNGANCGVEPYSENDFEIWYGENDVSVNSVDEVMNVKLFDGKSLAEIFNDITEIDF